MLDSLARIAVVSVVLLFTGPAVSLAQPGPAVPSLAPGEWRADLRHLAERLPDVHVDPFHTMSPEAFEAAVDELDRRIPALADHQVIVELARIVTMVGDGHTRLWLLPDERNGFRRYPIVLYDFADGIHLVAADRRHAAAVGGRLVHIGETEVAEARRRVEPLIHRDNPMGVRANAPRYLRVPEVLHALGVIDEMERATFVFEKEGVETAIEVSPVPGGVLPEFRGALAMPWAETGAHFGGIEIVSMRDDAEAPTPAWLRHLDEPHRFEWLPESGVLYVRSLAIRDDADESMEGFYERVFAAADTLPVEKLVIDLRMNGGGNNFLNLPVVLDLVRRPGLDRHGKVFVLVGRHTFSAATHLVTYLERFTHAVFAGEPTAGSPNHYGDAQRVELPNSGLRIGASSIYWQNSLPSAFESRDWTPPEIAVELSADDFASNRDPVLEAVVAWEPEPSLADRVAAAVAERGFAAGRSIVRAWSDDPRHRYLDAESDLNGLGYGLLREERLEEAIAVFRINTEVYPDSPNAWDSLGEAHATAGHRERAIELYEKALSMDPEGRIGANARRMLEQLREEE